MAEQVFFNQGGIKVTSTLVTLAGGKTYATANITSVSTDRIASQHGCCLLALFSLFTPPEYALTVATAAGETEGMRSRDRDLIEAVSAAIMQAIAARG